MSVYDIVLKEITSKLESGVVPWRQTWKSGSLPMNYISKKPYRGINTLLLAGNPYVSPYYVSFRQLRDKGGYVKPGEKGHPVVFFKATTPLDEEGKVSLVLRYYQVWNLEQTSLEVETKEAEVPLIQDCEELLTNMVNQPQIKHSASNPCYIPSSDMIMIPPPTGFESTEEYYAALFHELIHSTGSELRLKRFAVDAVALFGSDSYSEEELVAEIGASFLCGMTGILPRTLDNNAAYIHNWLARINNDRRIFFRAAAAAQKAVDYIRTGEIPVFFSYSVGSFLRQECLLHYKSHTRIDLYLSSHTVPSISPGSLNHNNQT